MSSLDPLTAVVDALKREEIIPDVIPTDFTPSVLFSIVYGNGKEALLSSEMAVDDTQEEPEINFTPLTLSKDSLSSVEEPTYTLVLTDPDARSRAAPMFREFRHWVITGLKAPAESSQSATNLTATKTKPSTTPYRGPGPPPGTGLHRYCFLLFQEPTGGYTIPEGSPEYGSALEDRRSWSAVKFGEKYGLKLVGANYFQCQNPDQTQQS